ncbi:MAG: ABC transporter transmembrane domain-containing protein [Acidobacteriota bacterium]
MNQPGVRPLSLMAQVGHVARLVWAERRVYVPGTIFVVFSLGTALVYPQVIRLIIDEAIQGGQAQRLNQLSLWMVGILIVEAVATGARDYYFGLGAERVGVRLRRLVFNTLLRQDVEFFDARDIGEITTRLWADVPPLEYALGEEFADSLRFAVFSVCGTGLLFYTSPQLTFFILLAVPPIVFATSVLGRRVKVLAADVQSAHSEAGAAATEVLGGIRTVRAFSQEPAETARYDRQMVRALEFARRKVQARALLGGVSLIAGEFAALLAIWIGGHLIVAGRMTTGALISFILYALLVARGFRNTSRFTAEALRAIGATQWVFELLDRVPHIPHDGGDRPADLIASIALEAVRFRYPTRPEVEALKGVDLHIAAGEVVALVGKSGSGKSTILNLLLRFYDPTGGRVLVGGRDVRELNPTALRSHIATVMQEPTLFSRTVAENIQYGAADASTADLERTAILACADEFIQRLPGGYQSSIGDRGVQLSGGQRQRLAIARAVLRRPKILILDEATSALDAELESVVQVALRALDYRPTMLIIAHRLSTVAKVDRVVVLDEGRIVESGTHDELIRTSTFYRQLVQTQLVAQ